MKHLKKALFSIVLLLSTAVKADDINGRSFFLGANVGNIAGGGLLERAGITHRHDADGFYACFSSHMEYNQSLKKADLGKYLSPIANNTFRVGPADNTSGDTATDVFSTFFLIEETYQADVTFKPTSKTFTSNLGLFVGLDEFVEGLWLDVNLPIVYNKREVVIVESEITPAGTQFGTDYFTNGAAAAQPTPAYTTFKTAMVGDKTLTAGVASDNMKYGKINGSQNHTKVGNVTVTLGYDFVNKENMHLGLGISGLINGNGKSEAVYMFEPSVGTGGRHGVGATVDGHVRLYEKDDSEINLHLKANVHHLFDATMLRTYDLTTKHGVWSRYLLFKEWLTANLGGAPVANAMVHGVNFTTLQAKIGVDALYDVNVLAQYSNGSFAASVGYGLSGNSKEKHKEWVDSFTTKNYGAWAYDRANLDTDAANATGQDMLATNIKIDGGNGSSANSTEADSASTNIIVLADLDTNSGLQPAAMVHQVYGDLSYRWEDSEWEPCLGVGGSGAFSANNKGLGQWGVHLHGGICF